MKIFLSWSGDTSHKVAIAFRDWLPQVIQSLNPYVSSEDIDKGTRWSTDIAKELEESAYGIILVTKENLIAPWVNFEAGALSKIIDKSNVSPFLFDVKRSDVKGPLLQFQSTIFEKEDICKLLKSINKKIDEDERLDEIKLERAFGVWWPELEESLKKIPNSTSQSSTPAVEEKDSNKKSEILEELLHLVRDQHKIMSNPDRVLPPEYLEFVLERSGALRRSPVNEKSYHMMHRDLIRMRELISDIDCSEEQKDKIESHFSRLHRRFHEVFDDGMRSSRRLSKDLFISDKGML